MEENFENNHASYNRDYNNFLERELTEAQIEDHVIESGLEELKGGIDENDRD
ncbi:MAG: hypothetical protein ACOC5T_03390 [Elusimicrobiota bacterium]